MDVLNGVTDFSPELLLVKHNLKEKERLHKRDLPLHLCGIYRVSRELVGTCYLKIKVVFPDIQTNFISSKADKISVLLKRSIYLDQLEGEALMENSVNPSTSGQLCRVHLVSGPLDALLKVHSKLLDHPERGTLRYKHLPYSL